MENKFQFERILSCHRSRCWKPCYNKKLSIACRSLISIWHGKLANVQQRGREENAPIAIEVYAFGQVLFLAALPGSAPENLEWMRRKRNTVLLTGHSSMFVGLSNEQKGERMAQQRNIRQEDYTDHGGSFPLLSPQGAIIGAVSISGLPSEDDHALALWGIAQLLR